MQQPASHTEPHNHSHIAIPGDTAQNQDGPEPGRWSQYMPGRYPAGQPWHHRPPWSTRHASAKLFTSCQQVLSCSPCCLFKSYISCAHRPSAAPGSSPGAHNHRTRNAPLAPCTLAQQPPASAMWLSGHMSGCHLAVCWSKSAFVPNAGTASCECTATTPAGCD